MTVVEAAHRAATSSFAGFGSASTRFSALFIAAGLVIVGLLCVGMGNIETETRIEELWAEKDTRLVGERTFFEEKFGGLPRKQLVAFTNRDESLGITTVASLQALENVLTKLFTSDETGTANPDEITISTSIGDGSATVMRQKDFCETPTVPPVFRPYPAVSMAWASTGSFMSYGYQFMTTCLPGKNFTGHPLNGLPSTPLPFGWGIDRFPCTRGTVLDCFREGSYDYPANLRLLENYADIVMGHPGKESCLDDFKAQVTLVLQGAGLPPATAAGQATVLRGALSNTVSLFWTFGYRWRPSYKTMTSAQIASHLSAAIKNNGNSAIQVPQCIVGRLPCCVSWNGRKVSDQIWLGGKSDVNATTGAFGRASATRTVINNFNHNHPAWAAKVDSLTGGATTGGQREDLVLQYEQKIVDALIKEQSSTYNTGNERLSFLAGRSVDDVVEKGGEVEGHVVAIGYVIMIVYACLSLGNWVFPLAKGNFIHSHMLLALLGILTVGLSTIAGFGFVGLIGMKVSPVAFSLVPVLSLAIGMDDMFVLAHTMARIARDSELVSVSMSDSKPEERSAASLRAMRATLAIAGPSVFLTSMANFCAFAIATATPIDAVQTFCWQMAITVATNFFFLMVIFVPIMSFDMKRVAAGRMDVVPVKIPVDERIADQNGDFVAYFAKKYYGPFLSRKLVKIIVLVLFAGAFGALCWNGFENKENGLRVSDIALRDTYQRDYIELQEDFFLAYDNFLVSRPKSFGDAQQGILDTQAALQNTAVVPAEMQIRDLAWLAASSSSMLYTVNGASGATTPVPSASFQAAFNGWATTTGVTFAPDMYCESKSTGKRVDCALADANTTLVATKMTVYFQNLKEHQSFIDAVETTRAAVDKLNDDKNSNFIIGYVFYFWEQYLHIEDNMYKVVGFSLLGVLIATFLFQFSIISSLLIAITILMIDIDIYGILPEIGVKLNAFSVVNLCMSVGLAVEFTAHIARAFLVAQGATRDHRMISALEEMLPPMINGALSSFLPILVLVGSKFPFFRAYYFGMFTAVIIIAFLHGAVLLPVILSLVGPKPLMLDDEEEKLLIEMSSPTAAGQNNKSGEVEPTQNPVEKPESGGDVEQV